TSGGTPPGSVEDEYLYGDALNRTTVPLPSVASSMVLRDIRARGELVPDFPDAKHVAATTGVHGLHVSELQRALTQPGKSPTPRTHESVAFAGAWRAATKNLGEDLVVSYDLPNAPGQALVERLDGNLDSYVSVMRTGQREVILDDVIGNRIEPAELGQRLGLDEEGANTVMTGLVEALEAAENMRQTPSTTSNSSPTADPARQVPAGPVDPLTSGHLPPHSPTSTNSPSRLCARPRHEREKSPCRYWCGLFSRSTGWVSVLDAPRRSASRSEDLAVVTTRPGPPGPAAGGREGAAPRVARSVLDPRRRVWPQLGIPWPPPRAERGSTGTATLRVAVRHCRRRAAGFLGGASRNHGQPAERSDSSDGSSSAATPASARSHSATNSLHSAACAGDTSSGSSPSHSRSGSRAARIASSRHTSWHASIRSARAAGFWSGS